MAEQVEGLPEGAIVKPIQGLPEGAVVRPISASAPESSKPVQPGFLESLGHMLGIGSDELASRKQDLEQHPIRNIAESAIPAYGLAKGLLQGGERIGGEIKQAYQAGREGNAPGIASHAISAIPFLGPALDTAATQAQANGMNAPGNSYGKDLGIAATTPSTLGTVAGTAAQTAPAVLGAMDAAVPGRPLIGQIPSASRAGKTLQSIREQAVNVPVVPAETSDPLARFQELTKRGGSTAKPATQLSQRLRDIMVPQSHTAPFNFPEARDFYSNISSQSAEDISRLNPTMRRQMGSIRSGLHQDLTTAADQIGRGEDYSKAIREYARAQNIKDAAVKAAKYAIPATGAGIAGKVIYDRLPRTR